MPSRRVAREVLNRQRLLQTLLDRREYLLKLFAREPLWPAAFVRRSGQSPQARENQAEGLLAVAGVARLLAGKRVTGFTRGEDAAALFAHMPFSLRDRMQAEGAQFIEQPPRGANVETGPGPLQRVHDAGRAARD